MKNNLLHSSTIGYRADIDGLRAIAVLSVVGFHAFPEHIKGGFIGVDVFFVISGFLISCILLGNLEKNTFSIVDFYARRIKRIFPTLLVVLISCLLLGWYVLISYELKELGKHVTGGAAYISNILLWQEAGYFDGSAETKPLLHLWSLGIEEQFYIVWPLVLWFCWKKKLNLMLLTGLAIILSFALNVHEIHSDPVAAFYSPQTRCWELLIGGILAYFSLYKQQDLARVIAKLNLDLHRLTPRGFITTQDNAMINLLSFMGCFFICCGIWLITKNVPFPGVWALLPTLGALLIIAAGKDAWINRRILSSRFLVRLGIISFPLYLWHWPLLSFARIIEGEVPMVSIRIAIVFTSILLAWLTYTLVEKPMRFGKHGLSKTILLIVLMIIVGYAGNKIYRHDGYSSRLDKQPEIADIFSNPFPPVHDFECADSIHDFKRFHFDGECKSSSKTAPPTVLFIGDSHMAHYRNAIWNHFSLESILMIVQTSCLPFSCHQFMQGECQEKYNAILGYLESNTSIKTVYLSGYWAYLMSGGFNQWGDKWRTPKPLHAETVASFKKNARHFISRVLKTNKKIVFLKDIPDLNFNIMSCYELRPFQSKTTKECSMQFAEYSQRVVSYQKVIRDLLQEFPEIKVYDPTPLFCKNERCIVSDEKLPYYINGDHLNHYGANMVFRSMLG